MGTGNPSWGLWKASLQGPAPAASNFLVLYTESLKTQWASWASWAQKSQSSRFSVDQTSLPRARVPLVVIEREAALRSLCLQELLSLSAN